MIEYKPVDIEDRELLNKYFFSVNYRNCDFSFATIFCWSYKYKTTYSIVNDFLVVRFLCDDGLPCFMMPIGNGDMKPVLQLMLEDARIKGDRFRIHAVTADMFDVIDSAMPHTFTFSESRDYFEYLYLTSDLIELKGKKYQPKRNHINRFKKDYPKYSYLPLTVDLFPVCIDLYYKWANDYKVRHPEEDLVDESKSVLRAFKYFNELELKGGVLFVEDQMVAFTYGEQITEDTFAIHAEKALNWISGAFPMINQLFAADVVTDCLYINREEDLGIESLRQAKMSYHPVMFLRRGSVNLVTA